MLNYDNVFYFLKITMIHNPAILFIFFDLIKPIATFYITFITCLFIKISSFFIILIYSFAILVQHGLGYIKLE